MGFQPSVAEHLKWYVYRLIDPRNDQTFYVGKGQADRIFAHASGDSSDIGDEETLDPKLQRIEEIRAAGLKVSHVVHRHGVADESAAYEVEAALIDAYPGLTNRAGGHGSGVRGPRSVDEINAQYAAEILEVRHRFLLVSVSAKLSDSESVIYEAARYAWIMARSQVEACDLVLARNDAIVIGAFRPSKWLEATDENFPKKPPLPAGRGRSWGFIGEWAEPDIRGYYVGKQVPSDLLKSTGNPIRYCEPK